MLVKFIYIYILLAIGGLKVYSQHKNTLVVDYYTLARYVQKQVKPNVEHWRLSVNDQSSIFVQVDDKEELFSGGLFHYAICKDASNLLYEGQIGGYLFYYSEPLPQMNWYLEDKDSLICDYHCQKASVQFRGKIWTVWYTLDIPYSDGPWKLNGLPGLILKAVDADKNYSFEAQKISWCDKVPSRIDCKDAQKTTFENFINDYLWYCRDAHDFICAVTGKKFSIKIGDKEWKPTPITPCLMEYFDDNKK